METQTAGRNTVLKKIEKRQACAACFSKRRASLFNRASQLSVLCGVVFSPAGNSFTFGNPSADAVIDRFLAGSVPPPPDLDREPNPENEELLIRLEGWKKKRQELENFLNKMREHRCYWRAPEKLDFLNAEEFFALRSFRGSPSSSLLLRLLSLK